MTRENERRRIIAELDVWAEGCAAARAGLGPKECPYPWQPGWHSHYLQWVRGLADTYQEGGLRTKAARRAHRARLRAEHHAAATARPWPSLASGGTLPVWFARLLRRVFA